MVALPDDILVFHQLRPSMGHHVRVSSIAPGWGSVNLSQCTHHPPKLGYSSRERRGGSLTTTGWDLHFCPWWSEPRLAIWVRDLLEGYTRKTSRRQWGSVLWRVQTQAFYQLSYPAPRSAVYLPQRVSLYGANFIERGHSIVTRVEITTRTLMGNQLQTRYSRLRVRGTH